MKVVAWNGCRVIAEMELEGDGPDIHIDPVNLPETVGIVRDVNGSQIHEQIDVRQMAR